MNVRHHFFHQLKTEANVSGTPAFILDNGRRITASYHLRVYNPAAYTQNVRFISSGTGLFPGAATARGTWDAHSGPFTIVPGAEKVFAFHVDCHRFALEIDGITGKLGDLRISGYAYNDVASYPGVVELTMTAGGVLVPEGDKEGFLHEVTGYIPVLP